MSKSRIYQQMVTSSQQTAVCPITGIVVTLDIPAIKGKALEYENPLARIENARDIATLTLQEHKQLHNTILAGVLLTLWNHNGLLLDRLSAVQRNELLAASSTHVLSEALNLFAQVGKRNREKLPGISLSPSIDFSSNSHVITSYTKTCRDILFPASPSYSGTRVLSIQTKGKIIKHESITSDIKKQAKECILALNEDGLISDRFASFLRQSVSKNNLVTLHSEIRQKIISKLEGITTRAAIQLINIYKDSEKNATVSERIFKTQLDDALDRFSDTLTDRPKPSLKDILAAKLNKTKEEQAKEGEATYRTPINIPTGTPTHTSTTTTDIPTNTNNVTIHPTVLSNMVEVAEDLRTLDEIEEEDIQQAVLADILSEVENEHLASVDISAEIKELFNEQQAQATRDQEEYDFDEELETEELSSEDTIGEDGDEDEF